MKGPKIGKSDMLCPTSWDVTEIMLMVSSFFCLFFVIVASFQQARLTVQLNSHGEKVHYDYVFIDNMLFKSF